MRTAPVQNYSLSIAGNKDKLNTAVVLGYFKQDGVLHNTSFERYTLRANNDYQINDKIKVGLNIAPSLQISNLQNTDNVWNVISGAFLASPILSPYDKNGDLVLSLNAPNMFPQPNWLRVLKEKTTQHKVTTVLSNLFAEVDIWNGIKYKFQAGIDIGNHTTRAFTPSTAAGGMFVAPPQKASGEYTGETYYNWTVENMLMYNKRIKEHSIDALVGYSAQKYTYEKSKLTGTDFPNDDISWIDAAATRNGENNMTQWSLVSLIGRVNYSFKDRYLLQATFRRDGCSRFGPGNKYANFPSVSAGWIASDEAFMEPVMNVMSYLKVRASYGLTGNYNIGDYTYIAGLENTNYVLNGSLYPGNSLKAIGNNDLTWEETKQLDLGLDFGFLNDRIFVQYDYYRKQTNGMLYEIDIPSASGFQNIKSNIGDFKSWGHEITISSKNLVNDFKWSTNFNISFNENEITKLGTNNTAIGGYDEWAGDFNRLQVGQPIGVFVGYVYDGVYMNQHELDTQPKEGSSEVGTVRMKDVSGPNGVPDGIIDANDRTLIGDPNPLFIFGLNNEFSYKNFDLSILMSGSVGGDIMNGNYEFTENLDGVFNVRPSVANRWRSEENPGDGVTPRTKTGTTGLFRANNSRWVEDGSYLAIKNVTLGYTVPFTGNAYISKARFYVTGQQLAVFSKYNGMNPEVALDSKMSWKGLGVDRTTYPVPRSFSIGCNITF